MSERSESVDRRLGPVVVTTLITIVSMVVLITVGAIVGGLAAGYRPVVILTGSMGETAPPGSLIVASPADGDAVVRGDVLIMRRPESATVTHRVIEVESNGSQRFAITQGDANEVPDAAPYALAGDQLVARWIAPRLGRWALTVFKPGPILALVGLAVLTITASVLRRIWAGATPEAEPVERASASTDRDRAPRPTVRRPRRRRRIVAGLVPVVIATSAGVAWALAAATEPVDANVFGTSDCFDPELASVQSGVDVHAVNGTVSTPIVAVDPTTSFVVASVRSNTNEPPDSTVQVELGGGGTSVDLVRATDAGSPPPIVVAWSVVSYDCGITVQRGTVSGDGSAQLDIPITSVDTDSAFVLVTAAAASPATTFGANDLFIGELADSSTVRVRTTGSVFDAAQSFAWQVVEFDDGADATVQTITADLGLGVTSTTVTIPSPVDPGSTFLIASAASVGVGPDIGERMVRTNLVDGTTVAVDRSVAGDPVEVQIQVVSLADGSNVRHGTVDLGPGQPATTVTVDPVDPSRATAFATVAMPGVAAGGMTDQVADDVAGEASATFVVSDPETVTVTREATVSSASFGWQVVEWAGPSWWDVGYEFRQRIDIDTGATAAPDAYTVPLTIDHAALVTSGLSLASGDDVRIGRWDGSTWTELDRVLEDGSTWNQVDTTLWFGTTDPIAADSTETYWLYVGNSGAGAAPADPEVVFLLTEDFDAGGLGDFEDRTGGTPWYQALPWTRRIPVTVSSGTVAADLTDFPLLVSLTSADLAANAIADGSDIRFTAADGLTPLAHEVESWDSGTGALAAWVLVPTLTAGADTTIHLVYGAADAPAQESVRSTWPAEIRAAWHLARDPAGSAPRLDDSTSYNHDGLASGSMTTIDLVGGVAGSAIDFDGVDDHLRADPFDVAGAPGFTVSALVNLDAHSGEARIVTKAGGATRVFELAVDAGGSLIGRLSLSGVEAQLVAGTVATGGWHHVAMTWDGAKQRLYVDGTEVGSQDAVGRIDDDPTAPVTIGDLAAGGGPVDGRIDEVRVETVARSAFWLAGAQSNQRNPGGFLSIGAPQTGSWFDQGTWSYRKPILVESDLVTADQTSYPLLVEVTDAELAAGATVNGRDLVFTAADGTTRLDHMLESWDQGSGAMTAWVLVPTLSSSVDTQLFLYYGNGSADAQEDSEAVFGPDADLIITGS